MFISAVCLIFLLKLKWPKNKSAGADPGFFLGGGAPLRNDVTDGEVKKFKSEYLYMKKKASSQGGVRTPCTPPLDPPLESMRLQMV